MYELLCFKELKCVLRSCDLSKLITNREVEVQFWPLTNIFSTLNRSDMF